MLLITSTANIKTWERDNGLYGGLSPLARGTQKPSNCWLYAKRFIPAGAGNTRWNGVNGMFNPVYPRWRGEHIFSVPQILFRSGLSPLARGTHVSHLTAADFERFIPAGAGNTDTVWQGSVMAAVYPRWRGEHGSGCCFLKSQIGLSPLARGTLLSRPAGFFCGRFIPAGAGNTLNITYY